MCLGYSNFIFYSSIETFKIIKPYNKNKNKKQHTKVFAYPNIDWFLLVLSLLPFSLNLFLYPYYQTHTSYFNFCFQIFLSFIFQFGVKKNKENKKSFHPFPIPTPS